MRFNNIYDHRYANGYREHLWGYEAARWWAIEHFIGRRFPVQSVANVLDYGAGSGLYVKLWENLFPNAELYFCDPSSVARDKFVGAFPQYAGRYKLMSRDEAPFHPESFDLVVSVEVIEHVQKLADYLGDIQRVLRRNGVFFFTTPCGNAYSIEYVYAKLRGQIEKTQEGFRRWKWEDPAHLRRLKSCELESVLMKTGFSNVQFRFRAHLFSFLCSYLTGSRISWVAEWLMGLDYRWFRRLSNGASMMGIASK